MGAGARCVLYLFGLSSLSHALLCFNAEEEGYGEGCLGADVGEDAADSISVDVFPFRVDPEAFQKSFPEKREQDQEEALSAFLTAVYPPEIRRSEPSASSGAEVHNAGVIEQIAYENLTAARAQVLKIYDEYMGRYGFMCRSSYVASGDIESLRENIRRRFESVRQSREYDDLSSVKRSIEEICFYIHVKAQANRGGEGDAMLESGSPIVEKLRRKFVEEDLDCTGGASTMLASISRDLLSEGNFSKLVAYRKRELLKDVAVSILDYSEDPADGREDHLQVHRVNGYTRGVVESFSLLKDESDTGFFSMNYSDAELSRYRSEVFSSIGREDFSMNFADRIVASVVSDLPYADPRQVGGDEYAEFVDDIAYELEKLGFADRFCVIDVNVVPPALGGVVFASDPETYRVINRFDRFLYFLRYAVLYELGSAEVIEGKCGIFDNITEPDIFKVPFTCFSLVASGRAISSDELQALLTHFDTPLAKAQATVLVMKTAIKFGYEMDSVSPEEFVSRSLTAENLGYMLSALLPEMNEGMLNSFCSIMWEKCDSEHFEEKFGVRSPTELMQLLIYKAPTAQRDRIIGVLGEKYEIALPSSPYYFEPPQPSFRNRSPPPSSLSTHPLFPHSPLFYIGVAVIGAGLVLGACYLLGVVMGSAFLSETASHIGSTILEMGARTTFIFFLYETSRAGFDSVCDWVLH